METMKIKIRNMSLQNYFALCVLIMVLVVVVLSGGIIWGCSAFCDFLLPESNTVYLSVHQTYADGSEVVSVILNIGDEKQELPVLTETDGESRVPIDTKYTIEKVENRFESLTPKRKLAYQFCQGTMIVVPALFSIVGAVLCSVLFYKKKLQYPLEILENATEQIANQNLDFEVNYLCEDEMGRLCQSFEQMRTALCENYKQMWNLLEERRLLQASIAHDLRNPIAIMEGYTEYLQLNLGSKNLSEKRIKKIVNNLNMAAKRMEVYTESVRRLNQMEDMEVNRREVSSTQLIAEMEEDFRMMAEKAHISLWIENHILEQRISVDVDILYRIMENLFGNALRYAKEQISLDFSLEEKKLVILILDDGEGFSEEILNRQDKLFSLKQLEDGHLGMGLAISRMLCKKLDGRMELYNDENHHAVVKLNISIF